MRQPSPPPLHHLKLGHLRFLAALADHLRITAAAEAVGISQPTASRLIVEIEDILRQPIHLRQGRGIVLTAAGEVLARRAKRILAELHEAGAEVMGITAGETGHLSIGAVTAPAIGLVLPALRTLRMTHPAITADVTVAPSMQLCEGLRAGRFDLVLARPIAPRDHDEFALTPIGTEPVAFMVRKGHPLVGRAGLSHDEMLAYDWVMPDATAPLHHAVSRHLAQHHKPMPRQQLTTASVLLTLTLLRQSNAIAPLAQAVADVLTQGEGMGFSALSTAFGIDVGSYALMTRQVQTPSPALARLIALLRQGAGLAL